MNPDAIIGVPYGGGSGQWVPTGRGSEYPSGCYVDISDTSATSDQVVCNFQWAGGETQGWWEAFGESFFSQDTLESARETISQGVERLKTCASQHYNPDRVGNRTATAVLATPISKAAVGIPIYSGTSSYTNISSLIQHRFFPDARMSVRILGTARPLGAFGRAVPLIGQALIVYDAGAIGGCAASKEW
jgi:hypothetical protein